MFTQKTILSFYLINSIEYQGVLFDNPDTEAAMKQAKVSLKRKNLIVDSNAIQDIRNILDIFGNF